MRFSPGCQCCGATLLCCTLDTSDPPAVFVIDLYSQVTPSEILDSSVTMTFDNADQIWKGTTTLTGSSDPSCNGVQVWVIASCGDEMLAFLGWTGTFGFPPVLISCVGPNPGDFTDTSPNPEQNAYGMGPGTAACPCFGHDPLLPPATTQGGTTEPNCGVCGIIGIIVREP